jgi:hypothetical protein
MGEQKSGLFLFAESELERIPKDDGGVQEGLNKHILGIVKVFCEGGHSGSTANYTINILDRLLRWSPISPIEDTPEDWGMVSPGVFQHKRCSRVFKEEGYSNGQPYIMDARLFSDDGGETWFSNKDSRELITFPYYVPTSAARYLVDGNGNISSSYTEQERV